MIFFLTPLVAERSVSNWELTCELLKRTLGSLENQSAPDFQSIVCCHDIPDFAANLDERFQFIEHPFAPPEDARTISTKNSGLWDMMLKRDVALYRANPDPDDFVILLDADDLVHRSVVAEIAPLIEFDGVLMNNGYELCHKWRRLLRRNNMVGRSGTSFALSGRIIRPPISLEEPDLTNTLYHSVWHSNVIEYLEDGSHAHKYLDGERVIYRTNTTLNHSDCYRSGALIRSAKHRLKFLLGRPVSKRDLANFGEF
tara:strand:- start:15574 stop:16341 length:768 start_codon:yes stop_codon:yes gene_type:complete